MSGGAVVVVVVSGTVVVVVSGGVVVEVVVVVVGHAWEAPGTLQGWTSMIACCGRYRTTHSWVSVSSPTVIVRVTLMLQPSREPCTWRVWSIPNSGLPRYSGSGGSWKSNRSERSPRTWRAFGPPSRTTPTFIDPPDCSPTRIRPSLLP